MKGVEFYNSPSGAIIAQGDTGEVIKLTAQNTEVINYILQLVKDNYVDAYNALEECYCKSKLNVPYHKYQMASRFIRCNWGAYDTLKMDIDDMGRLNIEQVQCPLRGSGDCKYENVICMPQPSNVLTAWELKIASLLAEGYCNKEVANILNINFRTVQNHITKIKSKLKLTNTSQIIIWYNRMHV